MKDENISIIYFLLSVLVEQKIMLVGLIKVQRNIEDKYLQRAYMILLSVEKEKLENLSLRFSY